MRFKKGFTLIELLVVLSIISLLSSVGMAALNTARAKSRDAKRASEIAQIRKAIELYYNDNSKYPASSGSTATGYAAWTSSNDASWTALQTLLSPYLPNLPHDPIETAAGTTPNTGGYAYFYYADDNGYCPGTTDQWYIIMYRPERSTPNNLVVNDPCPPAGQNWVWSGTNTYTNSAI